MARTLEKTGPESILPYEVEKALWASLVTGSAEIAVLFAETLMKMLSTTTCCCCTVVRRGSAAIWVAALE